VECACVAAFQLHIVLLVILCSDYLRTLYGAHSYFPAVPMLLNCSIGGVSPSLGAIRNRREDFILLCYTRHTSIATSSMLLLVSS